MDSVPNLAVEIARQVAPDEIFEAPLIDENFVKGGKSRKELLQQTRAGELGGFGIGEAAILPWIFHAMAAAAPKAFAALWKCLAGRTGAQAEMRIP